MKKTILLFIFTGCCFGLFSQNRICVDSIASSTGNGSSSNPYKTIQAAVNAASNGDIIQVAKGTYSEAVKIEQKKVQLLGGFAGNGNFSTANPQANVTIITGTSAAPCISIYIDQAISGALTISGFTIRNGKRGIEISSGWSPNSNNITIENNTIANNGTNDLRQHGGGIGLGGHNVIIRNNDFLNNQTGRGGAIATLDAPTNLLITGNRFENNKSYDDHAGCLSLNGTGTITKNLFDGNVAALNYDYGWGGAVLLFNKGTTYTLSYNEYRNNHAPSRGGAVFVDDEANVRMEHELLYNNTSKERGSAIYVDDLDSSHPSNLFIDHCTVAGNRSSSGGSAMYVAGSITQVQNSIFWNNGKDFEFINDGQPLAKLTVTYTLTQQGFTGTGNISSDPLFANASNGDFHVRSINGRFNPSTGQFVKDSSNSPAIDAGNPSSPYANELNPNGGRVNLGCYGNTEKENKSSSSGNEAITQISWTVFPNPAKENITIAYLPIGTSVNIYDLAGKIVYSLVIKNDQTTISTANFENGIYFVQGLYNGAVTARKLVVSK
jgi:hypothetical protein